MKRTALTILLFLSLGVIVNVAVAWGLPWHWVDGIYRPQRVTDGGFRAGGGKLIRATRFTRPGVVRVDVDLVRDASRAGATEWGSDPLTVMTGCGPRDDPWKRLGELEELSPGGQVIEDWIEFASGWPLLACGGYFGHKIKHWKQEPVPLGSKGLFVVNRAPTRGLRGAGRQPFVFAYCPIWPGFLVNTLFYAIILWLLIPGPFVLRRLIRLKRGRCAKCGYDLRGQLPGAGCPECGWNRQPEATT